MPPTSKFAHSSSSEDSSSSNNKPAPLQQQQAQISFDEFNRLRILDVDHAKHSEHLIEDAASFTSKLGTFNASVQHLSQILLQQSSKLEHEKLKAIGERTAIETESETRKRRCVELQHAIAAVTLENSRTQDYLESLHRIEQEQRLILERLQNN